MWVFVQNNHFCQEDRWITMLLAPGHNRAAPEPSATLMLWETTEEMWRRSFALIVAVKHCGRVIITGKSVLYFLSNRKVKST